MAASRDRRAWARALVSVACAAGAMVGCGASRSVDEEPVEERECGGVFRADDGFVDVAATCERACTRAEACPEVAERIERVIGRGDACRERCLVSTDGVQHPADPYRVIGEREDDVCRYVARVVVPRERLVPWQGDEIDARDLVSPIGVALRRDLVSFEGRDGVYEATLVLRDARGAERACDVGTVHTSGAVWSAYEFARVDDEHPEAIFSIESVETEGAWAVLVRREGDELRVERHLIVDLDGTTPPAPRRIRLPAGATLTPERG